VLDPTTAQPLPAIDEKIRNNSHDDDDENGASEQNEAPAASTPGRDHL